MTETIFDPKWHYLQIALARGWYVFPLAPRTKIPRAGSSGFKDASNDAGIVYEWHKRFPDANWALRTGKISGVTVIDIDSRPEKNGAETLEKLAQRLGVLPDTIEAQTGGGGKHLIFEYEPRITSTSEVSGLIGIDTKNDGGYIVIEPSIHPNGKPYTWLVEQSPDNFHTAKIPEEYVKTLSTIETHESGKLRPRPSVAPNEKIPEGRRDNDIFTEVSHAILKDKLRGESLREHMYAWDSAHTQLGKNIVDKKIQSALSRYQDKLNDVDPFYFPYNDSGNADRMWFWFKDDFIYTERGWWFWSGDIWRKDTTGKICLMVGEKFQELRDRAKKYEEETQDEDEQRLRKKITSYFNSCGDLRKIKSMVEIAQGLFHREDSIFDADMDLFNFENGTLHLPTGELRKHRREDYTTKSTGYDLNQHDDCPLFKRILCEAMDQDDAKTAFLIQILGSSLSGCVNDQVILLNHGAGSNGKSTIFDSIMLKVHGDYGQSINIKSFLDSQASRQPGPRPDLISLIGVRYATMSEPPVRASLDEALIKSFTGGDMVTARDLHKSNVSFKPCLHLFMSYNLEPKLKDFSYGMVRRIKKLAWPKKFAKDDELRKSLLKEIPSIAWFLAQACREWYRTGLQIPDVVDSDTGEYFYDQNEVAQFCAQYLEECTGLSVANSAMYDAWRAAAKDNGWDEISHSLLSRSLKDLGFRQLPGRVHGRRWANVKLKNSDEVFKEDGNWDE